MLELKEVILVVFKQTLTKNKLNLVNSHLFVPQTNPLGAPQNVKVKAISETELEITWESPIETRGRILYYRVRVAEVMGGNNLCKKGILCVQSSESFFV